MNVNSNNVVVISTGYEVDPCKVVMVFFEHAEKFDIDNAVKLLATNATWDNPIIPVLRGRPIIEKGMKGLLFILGEYKISEVTSLFACQEKVVFERVEKFRVLWAEAYLPVVGTYVVKNGRIEEWNDYFDWLTLLGKLSVSALFRPVGLAGRFLISRVQKTVDLK